MALTNAEFSILPTPCLVETTCEFGVSPVQAVVQNTTGPRQDMDCDQELAGAPDKVSAGALTPSETFVVRKLCHNTTFDRTDEDSKCQTYNRLFKKQKGCGVNKLGRHADSCEIRHIPAGTSL